MSLREDVLRTAARISAQKKSLEVEYLKAKNILLFYTGMLHALYEPQKLRKILVTQQQHASKTSSYEGDQVKPALLTKSLRTLPGEMSGSTIKNPNQAKPSSTTAFFSRIRPASERAQEKLKACSDYDSELGLAFVRHAPSVIAGDYDPCALRHTWLQEQRVEQEKARCDGKTADTRGLEDVHLYSNGAVDACENDKTAKGRKRSARLVAQDIAIPPQGNMLKGCHEPTSASKGMKAVSQTHHHKRNTQDVLRPVSRSDVHHNAASQSPPTFESCGVKSLQEMYNETCPEVCVKQNVSVTRDQVPVSNTFAGSSAVVSNDTTEHEPTLPANESKTPETTIVTRVKGQVRVTAAANTNNCTKNQSKDNVIRVDKTKETDNKEVDGKNGLIERDHSLEPYQSSTKNKRRIGLDGQLLPQKVRDMTDHVSSTLRKKSSSDEEVEAVTTILGGEQHAIAVAEHAARVREQEQTSYKEAQTTMDAMMKRMAQDIDSSAFELLKKPKGSLTHREELMCNALRERLEQADRGRIYINEVEAELKTRAPNTVIEQLISHHCKSRKEPPGQNDEETRLQRLLFESAIGDAILQKEFASRTEKQPVD